MTIMIIQFVKEEGFPVVCVATSTCLYDAERRSQRVKQFVSYGCVCCQENDSYLTSVQVYVPQNSMAPQNIHIDTNSSIDFEKLH